MAHHTLIDTCVWLDLATDQSAGEIIDRMEDLLATTHFRLVVPQVVREEFDRHKSDCSDKLAKSLLGRIKGVTSEIKQFANEKTKNSLVDGLNDFADQIRSIPTSAAIIISRIESLLDHPDTRQLETNNDHPQRAAERGYAKRPPFSNGKNSVADAIILESFLDFHDRHKKEQCTFSFITLNKKDFADSQDHRKPHADLGEPFTTGRISYCINLADEINRLIRELPPTPSREKKVLSDEIVRRVDYWTGDYNSPGICPSCGARELVDGGWRGYTWHKQCRNCGQMFDTGESMED